MADFPNVETDEEWSEEETDQPDGDGEDETDGSFLPSWLHSAKTKIKEGIKDVVYTAMGDILAYYAKPGSGMAKHGATKPLIGGPKDRLSKIAVIGGGPAGIHMSYLLTDKGYENITIFERSERIGGKSMSVHHRNAKHEMGTCYISPDYDKVKDLLREFGLSDQVEVVGRTVWEPEKTDQGVSFKNWIFREVAMALGRPDLSRGSCALEVFKEALAYTELHKELLGNYDHDAFFMPRPSAEALDRLNCSIDEFLTKNELNALKPIFLLAFSLQGYGFLETTSALYGMMWVTPTLLSGLVEQVKFRKALPQAELRKRPAGERRTITTLTKGFEELWRAMLDSPQMSGVTVRRQAHISAVRRDPAGVHITFTTLQGVKRSKEEETFDFLVIAAPIQEVAPVLDLHDDERSIFSRVETSTFITTLFDYEPAKAPRSPAVDSWFANVRPGKELSVWSLRDTHHLLRQNEVKISLPDPHRGSAVSYQYAARPLTEADHVVVQRSHANHFERHGLKNVSIVNRQVWSYFPHYDIAAMSEGVLWDIVELQGKYHTWYTGAYTCFEAVNAIVGYNKMLVDVWAEQQLDRPDAVQALVAESILLGAPASQFVEEPEDESAHV